MKLNPDCIRAVMLEIEKSHKYYQDDDGNVTVDPLQMADICKALPKYNPEDIYYTLFNLEQAGYIDLFKRWASGHLYACHVNHMTFAGHEFLGEIRDPKQWSLVKKGLKSAKSFSLDLVSAVAKGVAKAAIDQYVASLGL